jgi:AcrR family transcriptional regulator
MTPPSPELPRDLIAASARRLFEVGGYAGTTVRAIAADAGVDPSLVIRHYGSKDLLFLEVIGLGYDDPPIDGPIESLGERLARYVFDPENAEFRSRLRVMIRASDRAAIREGLRLTVRRTFIDHLVAVLPGDDRETRAQLIAAQLGGIIQATAGSDVDELGLARRERVVELYGRAIQSLVELS